TYFTLFPYTTLFRSLYAEFAEIHPATDPTPDTRTAPGTGPRRPVLMLHGGNVAGWMWAEHLSRLSDRTVLTPDVPGFGKNAGLRSEEHTSELQSRFD